MKIAVVTGASGNLGPIWCKVLEKEGYNVFKIDLPEHDITTPSKWMDDFINVVPDVVVNNAAIDNPPGSQSSFFGNFSKIMEVNIGGAIYTGMFFIPKMIKNGGGLIVNIGSIQGNIGADWRNYDGNFEKPVGYNCSKAALVQLSRSIAVQYGRYNIRSVTLAFSAYDGGKLTKEFLDKFLKNVPLGRTISKESLRAALIFALNCPELTGQQVIIDGGYLCF